MAGMVFDNAIAWAHFRLRGGWKQAAVVTGGYAAILGIAIFMTTRISTSTALLGWTNVLLGLQFLMLALYGSSVIGGAIRRDIASGLIESHRLMPIAPSAVVVGYLFGPPAQAIFFAIVNALLGAACTAAAGLPAAGQPLARWVLANMVVLLFVLFVWVVIGFTAFLAKNATALVAIVMSVGAASGGILLAAVPALMILATPLSGRTVFGMLDNTDVLTKGYAFSFVAQTAIGSIFFFASVRKYRRPDAPALGPLLGFFLLAAWVALSIVGILDWEDFAPRFMRQHDMPPGIQQMASILSAMIIALIPVVATANERDRSKAAKTAGLAASPRRHVSPVVAIVVATAIVELLAWSCLATGRWRLARHGVLLSNAGIVASFLVFVCYTRRLLLPVTRKAGAWIGFVVVVWCLLPFGFDLVRHASADRNDNILSGISAASPLGGLIVIWVTRGTIPMAGGLVTQGLLAAVPVLLYYATQGRRAPAR